MKAPLKKFLFDCIFYVLIAAGFIAVLILLISKNQPEKYFALFGCLVIAAFLFFSIYFAAVVAAAATFVTLAAIIIGSSLVASSAAIALYWGIIFFIDRHLEDSSEDYGRNKITLENTEAAVTEFEVQIARGEKLIPELENGISRYEKMAEFSLELGTTFSLKNISMFIINFVRNVFPSSEVSLIKQAQDSYDRWVYSKQTPLYIENSAKDYRFDSPASSDASSIIACPVFNEGQVQSIIKVLASEGELAPSDLRFLISIASLSTIAMENMTLFERTQELAITDDLTGLYTHSYFLERLNEEIARAARYGEKFVFLMIDIDHFKNFNDLFGHQAGDSVLIRVSHRIAESIRATDIVGRYGGEEISVILPHTDLKKGAEIAENIRNAVKKEKFYFEGKSAGVTVTTGVSFFPKSSDAEKIVKNADAALYEGKRKGRNIVVSFSDLQ
ncbi:MAG: hypothetical protein COT16_03135 [Elusimicrobia bacterium CG08_land_8_20_14_0_20_44_26]|nr:MAG: hypothetical protein COT16_03135 [Elusimicrobia bacterium CG08_land_8_20_14_0_20_44_26]